MRNFKLLSIIALIGTLCFSSCTNDEHVNNPLTEQNQEKQSFFSDLFNQGSDYTTRSAAEAAGKYTGTYKINSMRGKEGYSDVTDKYITISVNENTKTIDLEIESFKVGKMPAPIIINMENVPYTENGNIVHFKGTQSKGFKVLFIEEDIHVDGTITKSGTEYKMELKFTAQGEYEDAEIIADVDFSGKK